MKYILGLFQACLATARDIFTFKSAAKARREFREDNAREATKQHDRINSLMLDCTAKPSEPKKIH